MKNSVFAMGFAALMLVGCGPTASDFSDSAAADSTTDTQYSIALTDALGAPMIRAQIANVDLYFLPPTLDAVQAWIGPGTKSDSGAYSWSGAALGMTFDEATNRVASVTAGAGYTGMLHLYARDTGLYASHSYSLVIGQPILRDWTYVAGPITASANEIYDAIAADAPVAGDPTTQTDCLANNLCSISQNKEADGTTSYRLAMKGLAIDSLESGVILRFVATPPTNP